MDTKINYRNSPFRKSNNQRVKSIEYTHGVRGNNNGSSGSGMQGDGQGAQSFDFNNMTPEQMQQLQVMMQNKGKNKDPDRERRGIGERIQNMRNRRAPNPYPNAEWIDDAPETPLDVTQDGAFGNPSEEATGFIDDPTLDPRTQTYINDAEADEEAAYEAEAEPLSGSDDEWGEGWTQDEIDEFKLQQAQSQDPEIKYGGAPRFAFGGPETGFGTPGYGIPNITPEEVRSAQGWEQAGGTMSDAMRNRPMNGPSNVDIANMMMMRRPQPNMEVEPTNLAKDSYNKMFNEMDNRRRADLVNAASMKRQYGGDTTYQEGWEGEMSEADLREFINGGGQVEFI